MRLKIKNEDASESERLQQLVNLFGKNQLNRLGEKISMEWSGWDQKEYIKEDLLFRIIHNLFQGDWIDVANLAMFAWNLNLTVKNCVEKKGRSWK